jgi:phospholipase/carboxylesterase
VVEGWSPSLADRRQLRVFVAHGRADPVIPVELARRARTLLEEGGLAVEYHESDAAHQIDPTQLAAASGWLRGTPGLERTAG